MLVSPRDVRASFFFISLYVQNVLGYSPDEGRRDLPADGPS